MRRICLLHTTFLQVCTCFFFENPTHFLPLSASEIADHNFTGILETACRLQVLDKLHRRKVCVKAYRDSSPQNVFTVVLFINLDCFGVSCLVLEISAILISAFSQV